MTPRSLLAPLTALSALAACTGGDDPDKEGTFDEAILIAERFDTPDGRIMYMGAFPDFPEAPVAISGLTELAPGGDVFTCAGHAFFYNSDAGTLTRYLVEPDLALTEDITLQVGQEGIQGWTGANVCASDDAAYLFHETGGRAVKFDPTEMIILDAFDLPLPQGIPASHYLQFFEPFRAGDLVYFPLEAIDWYTLEVLPRSVVAVFDLRDETMSFTEDDRCAPSLAGHVDSAGNFYKLGGYGAFFGIYGPAEPPPDCVLKVPAGGKAIDPGYRLDVAEAMREMWPVDDEHALALITEGEAPPVEDLWSWWDLPVAPTLVNLLTGDQRAYPLPPVAPMNGRKITLDGVNYYQINTFTDDGLIAATELVALTLDGPETAFVLEGGDVLTLERLR